MKKRHIRYTAILFPRASFLSGVGSSINIAGNYYRFNYSRTEEDADDRAILADWRAVCEDFGNAVAVETGNSKVMNTSVK